MAAGSGEVGAIQGSQIFSLLHGDKKEERLKDDADIWLINPEGIPWLATATLAAACPLTLCALTS
jgi:hypothetical protein